MVTVDVAYGDEDRNRSPILPGSCIDVWGKKIRVKEIGPNKIVNGTYEQL